MLVDDAPRRGFERCRHRGRSFRDIVIHEPCEPFRGVARDQRLEKKKKLMLPFGESMQRGQKHRDVVFLLPFDNSGRVLAGAGQVRTVIRTLDFHEAFGAAADSADGLMQCRAGPSWLARFTHRAGHRFHF